VCRRLAGRLIEYDRAMRKWALAVILALAATEAARSADIRPDAVLEHIRFLSSDELKGRGNGTAELDRAADYIAQEFKAIGLDQGGENGYFQPFELQVGLTVGTDNRLVLRADRRDVPFELGTSYYPLAASANDDAAARSTSLERVPLVFAGYGLSIPSIGYDDYAGLDVMGKAVLIFSHEPQESDPNSKFNGRRWMPQTTLQAKSAAARSRGALALLVVGDPTHPRDEAAYEAFRLDAEAEDHGIPVLRIRRNEMRPLLGEWNLDDIARLIDKDTRPRSMPLDATVDYAEQLTKNRRTVRNVVGVLPGSDPGRRDQVVVIGAHYDHVGLGGRLSVTPERTGEIHNGADDNASGTAAIIEMARSAMSERGRYPRTLVFVAFAGEERGLLGSAYFARTSPAAKGTVAMLNLDMVGRARGAVDVSGLELSPSMEADLNAAVKAANVGLTIRREGPGAGRSDDSSFIDRKIPAINFFTGFHDDYHRPGDDWDKIDAAGTRRVATLALELAARLASRASPPEFVEPKQR
jgi:aminopeptidase YwaD